MSLHHESLPTELWLEIFAHLDAHSSSYSIAHTPFQPTPCVAFEGTVGSPYSSVVLVCRNWRAWAIRLLYRNIKLLDNARLKGGIDVPRNYGRWVRRAVVPYSTTVTDTCKQSMSSTEVLRLCPNLEVLVRPPHAALLSNLRFEFDAPCPSSLGSLKRLDWWHHWEASRSGGINSLSCVLRAAPNLEYLFIGGVPPGPAPLPGLAYPQYLPNLHTLRLNISNAILLGHIVRRWALPAVSRLVLDAPVANALDVLWETLGPQLERVEFGRHLRFLLNDALTPCLRGCPSLRELDYYVFFMSAPPHMAPAAVYPAVTSIGIHMAENAFLGDAHEWAHLEHHFAAVAGDMFPNLRRLRVFSAGTRIEKMLVDERFFAMRGRLRDRGCVIEFAEV